MYKNFSAGPSVMLSYYCDVHETCNLQAQMNLFFNKNHALVACLFGVCGCVRVCVCVRAGYIVSSFSLSHYPGVIIRLSCHFRLIKVESEQRALSGRAISCFSQYTELHKQTHIDVLCDTNV